MSFGQQVRSLRKARGMSQKELAAKASIDFTYLSKIENARRLPPRDSRDLCDGSSAGD